MTVGASYVYLRSNQPSGLGIYRCGVNGCGGTASFLTSGSDNIFNQPANDATALYWSSTQGVYRIAKQP